MATLAFEMAAGSFVSMSEKKYLIDSVTKAFRVSRSTTSAAVTVGSP